MFDRHRFFNQVRRTLFNGTLNQRQVDGMNILLDEAETEGIKDTRLVACVLGTTKWETAHTMWPVRETQRSNEPDIDDATARRRLGNAEYAQVDPSTGVAYYGRGFVQLTWRTNYEKMAKLLNVDLVRKPDLAMDPVIAAKIIYEGMLRKNSGIGDFTHRALEDYINETTTDWVQTRRVVNGMDHADEIAELHMAFHAAIVEIL